MIEQLRAWYFATRALHSLLGRVLDVGVDGEPKAAGGHPGLTFCSVNGIGSPAGSRSISSVAALPDSKELSVDSRPWAPSIVPFGA